MTGTGTGTGTGAGAGAGAGAGTGKAQTGTGTQAYLQPGAFRRGLDSCHGTRRSALCPHT
jgi:hypothetical protein